MKYENLNQTNSGSPKWDEVKNVPFAGAKDLSPLEDSLHYWAPEYKAATPEPRPNAPEPEINTLKTSSSEKPATAFYAEKKKQTLQRQRRKLIGILNWKAGQANLNLINKDPVITQQFETLVTNSDNPNLTPNLENAILLDIKDGIIGEADERWFLNSIKSPVSQKGPEAVLKTLSTLHEQRFLAEFTDVGFSNYQQLTPTAVSDFIAKFPTPLDFEQKANAFVQEIGQNNGARKEQEYKIAKDAFMQKLYGKRHEYHQAFQALQEEARDLPSTPEIQSDKISKNTGYSGISKKMLGAIYNWLDRQARQNPNMTNREYNQTLEKAILDYHNKNLETSEDSVLIDEKSQTYGIFDGAGGVEGGRTASRIASRVVGTIVKNYRIRQGKNLADTLTLAGGSLVRAERNGKKVGVTTGAIVKILDRPDGSRELAYASAGDSRIYIVHANGEAKQIVQDEGYENVITNFLGPDSRRDYNDAGIMYYDHVRGKTSNVTQYGEYPLSQGDRIVLCSDGITGDKGSDLMSDQELAHYVHLASTPKEAAKALLLNARKFDDRSVIVVNAYPEKTKFGGFLDRFLGKN